MIECMYLVCTGTNCEVHLVLWTTHVMVCAEYIQVHTVFVPAYTWYVHLHTSFYLYTSVNTEPCFTGFWRVLCDANMLVPDVQQPPADPSLDIDRVISAWRMKNFLNQDRMLGPWTWQASLGLPVALQCLTIEETSDSDHRKEAASKASDKRLKETREGSKGGGSWFKLEMKCGLHQSLYY